eukprot:GHVU01109121.1.p2 GENE.GHVU01109121.1~~GHVU01109121.1.p2  ORF type:complete len:150 (+),score=6.78 GHVU01109121.1:1469-1918(+)
MCIVTTMNTAINPIGGQLDSSGFPSEPLTHFLAPSRIHELNSSITHSRMYSPTHSLISSLPHSVTSLRHSLTPSLPHSVTASLPFTSQQAKAFSELRDRYDHKIYQSLLAATRKTLLSLRNRLPEGPCECASECASERHRVLVCHCASE